MPRLTGMLAVLLLASCAAAGPAQYGPAGEDGFGYSEQKIEDGRYRIAYGGSGGMPPEMVEDYAYRRAAEIALAGGYDWFRIVGRSLSGEERGGVSLGGGVGSGSYGRRSGVSVGVGGNFGRVGAQEYYTARIEVLLGEGEKPADGEVYDARSVLDSIEGSAPNYGLEDE
ncbi:MAG: hypothetical protein AAFW81_12505 [Pseudomonadota bacterium]